MPGNTLTVSSNTVGAAVAVPPPPSSTINADCRKSRDIPSLSTAAMHDQLIQFSKDQRNGILDLEPLSDLPTLNAQKEKPSHYTYLKEFRVEPCPLFKQHQCTNHRPYSCFYWHFANQRRRRPIRRKDGTFNYSADFYCSKYDENTGICPDGDDCPYLHRVYGDVERKYHLRYYKTALCVHPTDAKGHCSKNGAHCAFAHGPDDIRNPIFDIRELQHCGELNGDSIDNRDRLNFVVEDPIWQDQAYVLVNYKTEPCKKPPRLCRQGYACPYYHNGKDKRRQPQKNCDATNNGEDQSNGDGPDANASVAYRSTPCPNVKRGDEWGDPETCESGDNCPYCHTRTEQQFHPEIYKSTKCNDMLQHGYCPRGPFCAFAHTDGEMQGERRHSLSLKQASSSSPNKDVNGGVLIANPARVNETKSVDESANPDFHRRVSAVENFAMPTLEMPIRKNSLDQLCIASINGGVINDINNVFEPEKSSPPLPSYSSVLKHQHSVGSTANASTSYRSSGSSLTASPSPPALYNYPKAPGFEREQHSPPRPWPISTNDTPGCTAGPCDVFEYIQAEASKIKSNLYLHHDIGCDLGAQHQTNGHMPTTPPTPGSMRSNSFSPFSGMMWQHHQYSSDDDHGNLVDESKLPSISEKEERFVENGPNLYSTSGNGTTACSADTVMQGKEFGTNRRDIDVSAYSRSPGFLTTARRNTLCFGADLSQAMFNDRGQDTNRGVNNSVSDLRRSEKELASIQTKLTAYEECAKRARQECETWKKEAMKHQYRAQVAEQERLKAEQDRDKANAQFVMLMNELQVNGLWPLNTEILATNQLEHIRSRLRSELEKVEKRIQQRAHPSICSRCGRQTNVNSVSNTCTVCTTTCKSNGHHASQVLTT